MSPFDDLICAIAAPFCCSSVDKRAAEKKDSPLLAEIKTKKSGKAKKGKKEEEAREEKEEEKGEKEDGEEDKEDPKAGPAKDKHAKEDAKPHKGKATKDETSTNAKPHKETKPQRDGPHPDNQRKNAHGKDEKDFVAHRDLSSRVIARLQGHEKQPTGKPPSEYFDPIKEGCAEIETSGLTINFPITMADAELLRAHYCKFGSGKSLSNKIAEEIIEQFTVRFGEIHPCAVADVKSFREKFLVLGDTHGQLEDVLHTFHCQGPPSSDCVYLFNGNIADRGPNAVEIYLLLFVYFLADPSCIIINRGTHENEHFNALDVKQCGGFRKEVIDKFGSATMYTKFVKAFKVLPLCTQVMGKVFVVHGGLATAADTPKWSLTLDFIRSIDHTEFTMPDVSSTCLQDIVWNDLLWSEPSDDPGSSQCKRGCGIQWGPDITDKFLTDNKLDFIVRSHEVKDGYARTHDGRVLTVFSASNYCGSGNPASLIRFRKDKFPKFPDHEPVPFSAPGLQKLSSLMDKNKDEWEKEGELVRQAEKQTYHDAWRRTELSKLMVAIVETKPAIWNKFIHHTGGCPLVAQNDWEDCLCAGVGDDWDLALAWDEWKLSGAGHGEDHLINFVDFLRRFKVVISNEKYMSFKFNAMARIFDTVLHQHASLEDALKQFDTNGDGKVDMKEMREVLQSFELGLSPAQLDSLLHIFFEGAEEEDGVLKMPADVFLARFAIQSKFAKDAIDRGEHSEEERVAHEAMDKIGNLIAVMPIEEIEAALLVEDEPEEQAEKPKDSGMGETAKEPAEKAKKDEAVHKKKGKAAHGDSKDRKDSKDRADSKDSKEGKGDAAGKEIGKDGKEDAAGQGNNKEGKDDAAGHGKHKDSKDDAAGHGKSKDGKDGKGKKGHKDKDKSSSPEKSKDKSKEKPPEKVKHNIGAKLTVKVERVFDLLDADGNGFLSHAEFVKGFSKIPGVLRIGTTDGGHQDDSHLHLMAHLIDKHGSISIMEFLAAFSFEDKDGVTDALAENMVTVLFCHRHVLRAAATYFDHHACGMVHKDEFLLILQSLNAEIEGSGMHFSEAQMADLCEAASTEDEGGVAVVPYVDFFKAFEVVDSNNLAVTVKLDGVAPEKEEGQSDSDE